MKTIPIIAVIWLGLLAGCASHQQANPTSASGAIRQMEASDEAKIELAVYSYLLMKQPWGNNDFGAIFIEADEARVGTLANKFPNYIPPLKPASQAHRQPNQAPMDLATGKPGVLLTAKAVDPTNGVSEAVGTWDAGAEAKGLYAFVLMEMDGQWTIQSAK
ncbi:MAG TPA: hypothetical protein VMB80_00105 [Candidatus Acidoferrum sp.]|nr:hypothetical protein [Candidatus Acidoferrum sp.]